MVKARQNGSGASANVTLLTPPSTDVYKHQEDWGIYILNLLATIMAASATRLVFRNNFMNRFSIPRTMNHESIDSPQGRL